MIVLTVGREHFFLLFACSHSFEEALYDPYFGLKRNRATFKRSHPKLPMKTDHIPYFA